MSTAHVIDAVIYNISSVLPLEQNNIARIFFKQGQFNTWFQLCFQISNIIYMDT